jgi:hypothetical protein
MGIRLRKSLGYGLTDLDYEGTRLTDSRINLDSPLMKEGDIDIHAYLKWLSGRNSSSQFDRWYLSENADKRGLWIPECLSYSPEYGLPNVLVMRPIAMTD